MPLSINGVATLAGAAVLVAATLHAAPAAAQQAKYCNNSLVANAFFTNLLQNPRGGADIEYHALFQNQDPNRRRLNVALMDVSKIGQF